MGKLHLVTEEHLLAKVVMLESAWQIVTSAEISS